MTFALLQTKDNQLQYNKWIIIVILVACLYIYLAGFINHPYIFKVGFPSNMLTLQKIMLKSILIMRFIIENLSLVSFYVVDKKISIELVPSASILTYLTAIVVN